ncbi:MAG: damage-control phosphatase ARMT1 family protein [Thermoplasmatota archaeon]
MKAYLDCIPCFVRQSLEAARMATDNEEVHREILDKVMKDLRENSLEGKKPPDIADRVHFIVRKLTGGTDPYKEMKEKQNEKALYFYPQLKNIVRDSEYGIYTAVKLAIAGNIIDLGPGHDINLEKTVKNIIDEELEIDHFDEFKKELDKAENIFYLADNAGEIVFDKVFLEELDGKNVQFFVKDGPILNDAMREDAEYVGIQELAEIDVVSNGMPGEAPKRDSDEFIEKMSDADLVISKGQGNYEALSEVDRNIFFLLKAKCPVIADDLGVDMGSLILK